MTHATKSAGDHRSDRPAAERSGPPAATPAFADYRPEAAVQRELAATVARTSPKLVAQMQLAQAIRASQRMASQSAQFGVIRPATVPVSDRPGGAVSSAGSLTALPERASDSGRASWTLGHALSEFGEPTAQLAELPADSTGKLEDIIITRANKEVLTAKDLQISLITNLSKVKGIEAGFGYRLISLLYTPRGGFVKNAGQYPDEAHGMNPWPAEAASAIDDNYADIRALVRATLWDAEQLAYLDRNFKKFKKTHAIVVDVDWYLARTQSDVGFHKDSRGTTLFVNLTYNNEQSMQGASTKWDREGQPELEKKLPKKVKQHLKKQRKKYAKSQPDPEYGDLTESTVEPYARLSFADPSIWHSTPLLRHRLEALIKGNPPKDEDTLKKYVTMSGYNYQGVVDEYLTDHTDKSVNAFWNWFKAVAIDKYNRHGISSTIEPVHQDELTEDVRAHKRPLSERLNADDTGKLQAALEEEASRARTFIRTWVRLVKR